MDEAVNEILELHSIPNTPAIRFALEMAYVSGTLAKEAENEL